LVNCSVKDRLFFYPKARDENEVQSTHDIFYEFDGLGN
jgi:hypothetical protein